MEYKGIEVAVHADIEDENQTVYIPDVHTTATATDTEDHVTGANEDLIITDEVVLTGLKVGNKYTVKGVLMDKSTGEELKVNDESITAEETFIADAAEMTITLTYTLDAKTWQEPQQLYLKLFTPRVRKSEDIMKLMMKARQYTSLKSTQPQLIRRLRSTIQSPKRLQPSLIPFITVICYRARSTPSGECL